MQKSICIYCSSSNAVDPIFFNAANELATLMAKRGHALVYGGAKIGLMGELARTIHHNKGKVIGIMPQEIRNKGICYEMADELIITKDIQERKEILSAKSDAFVALPGGFGTLDEISEMITLKQIGAHDKPLVFLNINNYYDPLVSFFENMYDFKFSKSDYRDSYYVTDNMEDCIRYIEEYIPTNFAEKFYYQI